MTLSKCISRLISILLPPLAAAALGLPCSAQAIEDSDTLKGVTLKEVVVKRTKEHYSKKNNPAVDFARRLRQMGERTDPKRNDYYSFTKHQKHIIGLNDFSMGMAVDSAGRKQGKFDFLHEYVDSSDLTGRTVLPLSVKERVSRQLFRKHPHAEKELVTGSRQAGIDEVASLDNMQTMVEDIFREVDLYDKDIPLLRNRFVSPLSPIAPDFYKFYLSDTTVIDGIPCIVLSFAPRNPATFGFLGRLYVDAQDSTMFVRKIDMGVSPSVNLNFVDRLRILQQFEKAPDGSRLKVIDDMNIDLSLIKGTQSVFVRRTSRYSDHSFAAPTDVEELALLDNSTSGEITYAVMAHNRDESWWTSADSQSLLSVNEARIGSLMHRLREVPIYKYGERFLRLMIQGYVPTGKPSKFDIGPLNTILSYNSVEGFRLRAGGMTTANLFPHWFARGYVAYGTRDRKWKHSAELEYTFNRKTYHTREFPMRGIRISNSYDIFQIGQDYAFTNADNIFLSAKRGSNHLICYRNLSKLTFIYEWNNDLSITTELSYEQLTPGPWLKFPLTDGSFANCIESAGAALTIRYAPGEKFYQMRSGRVAINADAPVFTISHKVIPGNFAGSRWWSNRTDASIAKRFWLSAFGSVDIIVKGGHQWNRTSYLNLAMPDANLSFTIQPESFPLLNPMEFIADSYASWFLTYQARGALINMIPVLKKTGLREVVSFRGWWGHLSSVNNPANSSGGAPLLSLPAEAGLSTGNTPYMEAAVGIANIFKLLRIDYTWRLTHRHTPGSPDGGFRIALQATF